MSGTTLDYRDWAPYLAGCCIGAGLYAISKSDPWMAAWFGGNGFAYVTWLFYRTWQNSAQP